MFVEKVAKFSDYFNSTNKKTQKYYFGSCDAILVRQLLSNFDTQIAGSVQPWRREFAINSYLGYLFARSVR